MPSSKEQEVLERQRQLAASLKLKKHQQEQQQQQQQQQQASNNLASTATATKSTSASASSASKTAAKASAAPTLKRPSARGTGTTSSSSTLKRPSTAKTKAKTTATAPAPAPAPVRKRPASVSAILAAARSKARVEGRSTSSKSKETDSENEKQTSSTVTSTAAAKASIPRQQKNKSLSAFSSLVKSAATSASMAASTEEDYQSNALPSMQPDDYWKHLREWDITQQIYKQLEQQKNPNADLSSSSSSKEPKSTKELPDIFLNARHYVAAWAPLCLAETRAQILSEWLSDGGKLAKTGMQISATPTDDRGPNRGGRDRDASYFNNMSSRSLEPEDSICLRLNATEQQQQRRSDGGSVNFMTNDIVVLVPSSHKDMFVGVLKGKYQPPPQNDEYDPMASQNALFKKWGVLVGHVKCNRKGITDVLVEVSKRKWALVPSDNDTHNNASNNSNNNSNNNNNITAATKKAAGKQSMWMWKVGANITALREFTALCRMDQLPMKRFLLGQHLDPHDNNSHNHAKDNNKNSSKQLEKNKPTLNRNKSDLLEQMGGSQALGKGFTKYARQKFNPSQLMAIAASAHEYGDGGFTLIKGPPGTGSKYTIYC